MANWMAKPKTRERESDWGTAQISKDKFAGKKKILAMTKLEGEKDNKTFQ